MRVARLRHRLTQRDVARLARISQVAVSKVETGRMNPRPITQHALASALGYSAHELWPRTKRDRNPELVEWARLLEQDDD